MNIQQITFPPVLMVSNYWITTAIMDDRPGQHVNYIRRIANHSVNILASYSEIVGSRYFSIELLDMGFINHRNRLGLANALKALKSQRGYYYIDISATSGYGKAQVLDTIASLVFPLQGLDEVRILARKADEPSILYQFESYLARIGFNLAFRKCVYQSAPFSGYPIFELFMQCTYPEGNIVDRQDDMFRLAHDYGFELDTIWPSDFDGPFLNITSRAKSSCPATHKRGRYVRKMFELTRSVAWESYRSELDTGTRMARKTGMAVFLG